MRNFIAWSAFLTFCLLILIPITFAAVELTVESKIACVDNSKDSFIGFLVSDSTGAQIDNSTTVCNITLRIDNTLINEKLKYANGLWTQNLSVGVMSSFNQQLVYHVHCVGAGTYGYLTQTILVGDCTNYVNREYFDRQFEPTITWAWALALIIITLFTIYFVSQHHPLSYMFLIIDLMLMNVMFWLAGQACNLNELTFCVTMWSLYRISLIITFFVIVIIFIELLRWLIRAKDRKNKKTEFEQYGYNG